MVTHPNTNQGRCCLTQAYYAVGCSSMPIVWYKNLLSISSQNRLFSNANITILINWPRFKNIVSCPSLSILSISEKDFFSVNWFIFFFTSSKIHVAYGLIVLEVIYIIIQMPLKVLSWSCYLIYFIVIYFFFMMFFRPITFFFLIWCIYQYKVFFNDE